MARPVMLSNGQMMVGLNEHGLVNDFYYPYVGLDNLTNARSIHHKIGVWVDGIFSWVDNESWLINVDFENDALFSKISAENKELGIILNFKDFIDCDYNSMIRRVSITNASERQRDIRVFMHQVFEISRSGRADTALFVPDVNYILDYKGKCALLIYAQSAPNISFDQYAVGNYAIEGKEGTFKDAEDGVLSMNAVEYGGVDSVIRLMYNLLPGEVKNFDYWIIATTSQYECEEIHNKYIKNGIDNREEATRKYWQEWLAIGANSLHKIDNEYLILAKKSMLVIKAHTDKRGGVLASGDSSIYNYGRDYYCYDWARDGAYAMWPLIRLGYKDEPKKFFEFCRDTLHRGGYLMHKYQPDRSIGSTWHPLVHGNRAELAIQEDETAVVIFMLGEYYDYTKDRDYILSLYKTLIQPAANFMSSYIDEATNLPHASYDLWEEKFLSNSYTAALVAKSLRRAAEFADLYEYPDDAVLWQKTANKITDGFKLLFNPDRQAFRKGLLLNEDQTLTFDNTLDISSLYAMLMFTEAKTDSETLTYTVTAVEKYLLNTGKIGGVIRYENDSYMRLNEQSPSNPWFVCTLWLAQYYIQIKDIEKAKSLMQWTMQLAMPSGVLSEQIDPENGRPVGVAPLVWSHAEFLNTALDLAHLD